MVIAERTLKFRDPAKDVPIAVKIHQPVLMDQDWACTYEICWPNRIRKADIYGVDSMQALILALYAVGSDIYSSDEHKSGNLRWGDSESGYGFPLPQIIRDLMIGGDTKFFS